MRVIILALMTFFQPVFASASVCDEINSLRFDLEIHAMNLMNLISTRTPDGGHYKRKFLKCCRPTGCEVGEDGSFKAIFEPGHPDADTDGYVKYPNIDGKNELVGFEAAFAELATLAAAKQCQAELTHIDSASLVTYSHPIVKSDFLLHSVDGSIIWRRTLTDGTGQNVLLNDYLKK
jgi:flagellar basal body rod protein FlgC